MEVIIYTNTGCSACHQAMDFLTTHKVSFVEKSLATDPSARDELVAMGFRADRADASRAGGRVRGCEPW